MRSNQVRLNCGITMPLIGLGTYSYQNDRETTEVAIHKALKVRITLAPLFIYFFFLKKKSLILLLILVIL
jgi:hypothetical protein